jgi:hypothetical protein
VTVAGTDVAGVDISLPEGHAIRGTIGGSDPAAPLTSAAVTACSTDEDPCAAATRVIVDCADLDGLDVVLRG